MALSSLFILGFIGFLLSLVLFKIGIRLAHKIGLVDKPDQKGGRKNHENIIPLIGGLVIVPVFIFLCYIAKVPDSILIAPLFGGVILLLIIGALDDKFEILPWARFVVQIWVSCFIAIFCQAELTNLGNLFGFGDVELGWFGVAFTATCLVLLMNAINMLDGVDGLAGGFIAIAVGWFMFAAWQAGTLAFFAPLFLLLMPLLAFLCFNARHPWRKKASLFMGDAGSMSLALILGWFAITMAQAETPNQIFSPVVIIWIMTVPIVDTFAVFFTRMRQGRSAFDADRLHLHYRMIDSGLSPAKTTYIIWCIAIATGAIGYVSNQAGVPDFVLLYSWSAIWLGYAFYRIKNA